MSDKLVVEIDSKDAEVAMRNLDRLTAAAEQMGKAFENTKGATSALRELRLMLTGIKGQGSSLDELKNSIQSLNSTADSLKRSFAGSVGQLGRIFKNEMAELKSIVQETGLGVGRAAAKGIEDGMAEAPAAIRKQGRTIAAAAKAEATRIYEAMVAGQANAKIKDPSALLQLQEAGATLSPYHKQVLVNWKDSQKQMLKALKKQLAEETIEIQNLVKTTDNATSAALSAGSSGVASRSTAARARAEGYTDAFGVFISEGMQEQVAKIAAAEESAYRALSVGRNTAGSGATAAARARAEGYTDAFGVFVSAGMQEQVAKIAAAEESAYRALSVGRNTAGSGATAAARARAEGYTNAFGVFVSAGMQEQAAKVLAAEDAAYKALSVGRNTAGSGATAAARARAEGYTNAFGVFISAGIKDQVAKIAAAEDAAYKALSVGRNTVGSGATAAARTRVTGNTNALGTFVPSAPIVSDDAPKKVDALSAAFRKLTIDGNNVHSMARGLASGFNLLWLTWGNLVPLFAGAAISNGFMQTIKLGMQVGHTFQTIASLGEVSAEGVAMLRTQLYEIGQSGPYGPEQVAEAMKTLALAGLQLNEILAVTPTVLNFALAGTTSITQAADVLVSVTSAFGTGAAGFEESADIITRSAADSKASVESFGEAMKTASVVGELYGAAQRDVALMIQYLSQVGIQGTSAGTAVRNAMADISGRSGQAQRVLESLGAEFRQSTGEVIPFIDQMRELNRITKDYDAISQKNIINAIYGERGSKVAAVGLQAFNTAAKDASKYSNKLEEDLARLEDAAGDSAIASAQMAQSTQKAFEAVAATAKTTLVEAFDAIEPQMYLVADALRKAFSSDEAKEGLRTLVTAVADLAMVVAKNLSTIVEYGLAWAEFKVAVFGVNAIVTTATALLGLYTNAKIKDTAATIAQTAAEGDLSKAIGSKKTATLTSGAAALSMGTKLLGFLPIVGNAILLGSLAWDLYKSSVDETGKTVDNYVDTKADNIITALENETRHIREVNELRAQGLTLMEAEARVKFSNSKSEMLSESEAKIETAEAEIRRLRTVNASYSNPTDASYGLLERKENTAKILALEAEISEARSEQGTNLLRMTLAENERREAAQETLRLTRLEQEAAKKSTVTGTKTWSLDEFQGWGKGFGGPKEFYETQKTAFDKSIQEIEKRGKTEIEKLQSIAADKKAILDSEQQAGLLSTEEYNSQLMVLLKSSEDAQIAEIRKTSQDFFAEYVNRHRTISDLIAKAEATPAKGKGASAAKAANLKELRAELSTLEELGVTSSERWASAIDKLTSRYDRDLQVAINKNLGSLKKLREEDDKFWKDQTDELAKAKALDAVNQQYESISDSVFSLDEANKAYALAFADSASKSEAYIGKLSTELETAQDAAEEFWHAAVADGEFSDTDSSGYISYLKKIQGLEKLIIDARAKGATLADDTGQAAFARKRREQNTKLASDLSDAVMTALVEGGEAGKKKLRDVLVAELSKPIKMVVDLVMKTAVNGIISSLGMGGGIGTASAATGAAGGGILGGIQTASNLNTLWGAGSQALYGATAGASAASLGYANLVGAAGGDAIGALATANGMWEGVATGAQAAAQSAIEANLLLEAGTAEALPAGTLATAVGEGTAAGGGMMGALSSIPGWGWALAGVAALASIFGKKKIRDTGIEGDFGGETGFEGQRYTYSKKWFSTKTERDPLEEEVRASFGDAFIAARESIRQYGEILSLPVEGIDDFTSHMKLSLKGLNDQQVQEAFATAIRDKSNELAQQVLGTLTTTTREVTETLAGGMGDWGDGTMQTVTRTVTESTYAASEYAKTGEKAIDTLTRLATSLSTVNGLNDAMGYKFEYSGLAGAAAASKIADAFGGVEAMAQSLGSYISNYYSESEQRATTARTVSKSLAEAGLDFNVDAILAATRPQIRTFVEGVRDEFGVDSKQYVAAINAANALSSITQPLQSIEQAAQAIDSAAQDAAKAWEDINKALASDRLDADIALLRAMGQEEAALKKERERAIEGFDAQQVAMYDGTQAILRQVAALEKQAEATRLAQERAEELAATLRGELPGVIDKYLTPEQRTQASYDKIAADLGAAGVNVSAQTLMGASKDQIAQAAVAIYNLGTTSDETRLALIRAASGLADLKDAAEAAAEAAQGIVDGSRGGLDNLIKSLTEGASKASGGAIGRLSVTGAEYEQFQGFAQQLDGATQALKELEKLNLGDEFQKYADQIGAIVRETETLLAGQLSTARLLQGDAAGALAALGAVGEATGNNAARARMGADNAARARMDADNALRLYAQASADALAVSGIDGVLGTLQSILADPQLWQPAAQAITQGIVQASGDVGFAVRDAVAGVAEVLARQGLTSVSGPGIAGVHAAQAKLDFASVGGWARGSWQMGEDVVAYGQALDRLDSMLKTGKLSAQEHADAIGALNTAMGGTAALLGDTAAQAERLAAAQQALGDAGLQSIGYYFDWYGRESDRLAEAARQAGTALGQTTDAIGRLGSASSVFAQSAAAAASWEDYAGLSSVSKARLVADSARRAAAAMTTADAERAAAALAKTGVFGNVRDAALYLDGIGQYDSKGFEDAFARIGAALGRGQISEAQYTALFDTALEMYRTGTTSAAEAARELTGSFERLRDVMGDFADGLLIGDKTTLGASQTLAEIQRQYAAAFGASAQGDTDAMSQYTGLAELLLDKDRYSTQAEYNAAFGRVYGDARELEARGVDVLANSQNGVVTELQDMNAKLNKRVEGLEKNLLTALAQIAKNTADTHKGVQQQTVIIEEQGA